MVLQVMAGGRSESIQLLPLALVEHDYRRSTKPTEQRCSVRLAGRRVSVKRGETSSAVVTS
jgi:hypothetical protein